VRALRGSRRLRVLCAGRVSRSPSRDSGPAIAAAATRATQGAGFFTPRWQGQNGDSAGGAHPISEARARSRQEEGAMTREHFEALVEEAFQAIPREFRRRLKNIIIVVESEPSPALLAEMEIEPPDTLFGLYQGTPLTQRGWDYGNRLPDRIVLFQRPITEGAADEDEIFDTIAETLIHEAGHYFGMSEEQIQVIEEQYWRSGPDDQEDDPEPGPPGRS